MSTRHAEAYHLMSVQTEDVRTYRPFIDGLRAVAILTVVGCHVGMLGVAGGYVGVDIFFVISGYLIIGQIDADVRQQRFSFLDFAARRALRILPAFLLVMISSLVLLSVLLPQYEYKSFAESFASASVMLANHFFLGHQGYFDRAAFTHPLLHMWSLSVEEQFYLAAPLAIVSLYAITRKYEAETAERIRGAVALALIAVSFILCVAFSYGVSHNPAFYLMPMRGWEFIIGGRIPDIVNALRRCSPRMLDGIALLGVALIAYAVLAFDASTRYPTYRAAIPVLGTALVIACGIAFPRNITARALATQPLVSIGLISYAWYLWHWPLLTFLRTSGFDTNGAVLTVIFLSLVLAVVTYIALERPISRWRRTRRPHSGRVTVSMVAGCLFVGCLGYSFLTYVAPRLQPELAGYSPTLKPGPVPPIFNRGLLVGDSHASTLASLLTAYASRTGSELREAAYYACPPLLDIDTHSWSGERIKDCKERFAAIDFSGSEYVIIAARWNYYLNLPWSDPYYPPPQLVSVRPGDRGAPVDLLRHGLTGLIVKARKAGVRRILLVGPLPEFPMQARDCLVRALRLQLDNCFVARATVDARRAIAMEMLHSIAKEYPEVRVADPINVFCTLSRCTSHQGRTLFFHDTNHIIAGGIERLYSALEADMLWAFGAEQMHAP